MGECRKSLIGIPLYPVVIKEREQKRGKGGIILLTFPSRNIARECQTVLSSYTVSRMRKRGEGGPLVCEGEERKEMDLFLPLPFLVSPSLRQP